MQLTAAGNLERVGGIRLLHTHGHVRLHLLEEAVAQVAARHIFALAARKGAVVHHEKHGDGGLVDLHERKGLHAIGRAGRLADVQIREAGHGHEIAQVRGFHLHSAQALELIQLADLHVLCGTVAAAKDHLLAVLDVAALHTADADAADVIVVIDVGEQDLRRAIQVSLRGGNLLEDHVKQRLHVRAGHVWVGGSIAVAAGGIHNRELELIVVRAELDEQVEHLVDDLQRGGRRGGRSC